MPETVLITGASSGFGRRSVARFLDEGWNVVATLRDPRRWADGPHERLLVQALDVRSEESIAAAVAAAAEQFGRLDAVVNNAGIGLLSVFEATPTSVVEDLFETNVYGPMRVIRAALPQLHANGGGRIVNVTSLSATVPEALMAVYSASKAALHSFSESVSYELATRGVTVRVVEPGFVPGTGFIAQTRERFGSTAVPEAYQPYLQKRLPAYEVPPPPGYLATEDDVAAAIFTAATDPDGPLRYIVGADAVDAARVHQSPTEEYDAWRLARFAA